MFTEDILSVIYMEREGLPRSSLANYCDDLVIDILWWPICGNELENNFNGQGRLTKTIHLKE